MERKHLRIPRSLLKHEKTRKEFTNDFLPSEEKFHSSSSTQEADPHGTAPHLDFIHLQALLCSSLPQSFAGTFNEESDVHGLLFDLFGDVITREKLKNFCTQASVTQITQIEYRLKSYYFKCNRAISDLKSQQKKFNLQAQNALHLYELASMTHEDRMQRLDIEWRSELQNHEEKSQTFYEIEKTLTQLQEAIKAANEALHEATSDMEQFKKKQHGKTWKCTATLQLVSQIHDALQEFALYRERLILYRSVVEVKRRGQHNRLQELKRNLRVFCRIRPCLDEETSLECVSFTISKDTTQLYLSQPELKSISQKSISNDHCKETFRFCFDHVFSPESSQERVFQEVSSLIQSALDGFNVALLAYGQTGSGKTFTMEGKGGLDKYSLGDKSFCANQAGIIPRAVDLVFRVMQEAVLKGWEYKTELSILEIYNESIRDLLSYPKSSKMGSEHSILNTTNRPNTSGSTNMISSCEIKLNANGNTTLINVLSVPVKRSTDVYRCLTLAQKQRSVASTASNQHSSRSHCVFQLKIRGQCMQDCRTIQSTLSMVDLAGCERVEKSLVTGERLREAQYINKSLASLGDVIYAIANRKSHIPFRNSKLTMLLKDSLGGQAKTLMFVNISPLAIHFKESLTSLRFAVKANSCSLI